LGGGVIKDAHCNTSAKLFTTWWVQSCSEKKKGIKTYMEMDEGHGEVVLALVERNFGHLPQHQYLLLLLHDERCYFLKNVVIIKILIAT
jgi:hypothetical protein